MTDSAFQQLDRFVDYAQKRFKLSLLAGLLDDSRQEPDIPSRAVGLSLLLGEVVHIPSLLQLEQESRLPQWQGWVGYRHPVSHDTFGYASNRMKPERLRRRCFYQPQPQTRQRVGREQNQRIAGDQSGCQ